MSASTARKAAAQLIILAILRGTAASDPSKPHAHTGLLKKYDRAPPTSIGMSKLDVADEELRKGEPMLKQLDVPGGWTRMISVQDVHAPEKVVWSAINDLPNYPKYVEGVVACDVYSSCLPRFAMNSSMTFLVSGERATSRKLFPDGSTT